MIRAYLKKIVTCLVAITMIVGMIGVSDVKPAEAAAFIAVLGSAPFGGTVIGLTTELRHYEAGTQITLTAVPDRGYVFKNWDLGNGRLSTEQTCMFTVDRDYYVNVIFQMHQHHWTKTSSGNTITAYCGECEYSTGLSVHLIAPDKYYDGTLYNLAGFDRSEAAAYDAATNDSLSGQIVLTYYTNPECTAATDPTRNGSESSGGAPSKIGRYYVAYVQGGLRVVTSFEIKEPGASDPSGGSSSGTGGSDEPGTGRPYSPTSIVNGNFDSEPWESFETTAHEKYMYLGSLPREYSDKIVLQHIPNGVDGGWNTTENSVFFGSLFEYIPTSGSVDRYGSYSSYKLARSNCIEMNANNAAVLYQDLSTHGGDVIRWTLKHGYREINYSDTNRPPAIQAIRVEIGSPEYSGKSIVYPTGVGVDIDTAIEETSLAKYVAGGVFNGSKECGIAYPGDLDALSLDTPADWQTAGGVYLVPNGQDVTRFAFVSDASRLQEGEDITMGNLLDDITFETLLGNLFAVINDDESVTVTGYWGERDSAKRLVALLDGSRISFDMSSFCGGNFSITIPAADIGEAMEVTVYHEDYPTASRTVRFVHTHIWKTVIDGDTITTYCVNEHKCGDCEYQGEENGYSLDIQYEEVTVDDITYYEISFDEDELAEYNELFGFDISEDDFKYYHTDGTPTGSGDGAGKEGGKPSAEGEYIVKLEVNGETYSSDYSITGDGDDDDDSDDDEPGSGEAGSDTPGGEPGSGDPDDDEPDDDTPGSDTPGRKPDDYKDEEPEEIIHIDPEDDEIADYSIPDLEKEIFGTEDGYLHFYSGAKHVIAYGHRVNGKNFNIVNDNINKNVYLDLTTETITADFSYNYYSLDNGKKWYSCEGGATSEMISKWFGKICYIMISDKLDGSGKKPAAGAKVYYFGKFNKRPISPTIKVNYSRNADDYGRSNGQWLLTTSKGGLFDTGVVEFRVMDDTGTTFAKNFTNGATGTVYEDYVAFKAVVSDMVWGRWPHADGVWVPDVSESGKTTKARIEYRLMAKPDTGVGYYPSGKSKKITVSSVVKAPLIRFNYAKETLKLKKGMSVFFGTEEELESMTGDIRKLSEPGKLHKYEDFAGAILEKTLYVGVKSALSLKNYLRTEPTTLLIWQTATDKKPMSARQVMTLAGRYALTEQNIPNVTVENGKVKLPDNYEIFYKNKWTRSVPKVTETTSFEIRYKSNAKSGSETAESYAAGTSGELVVFFGITDEAKQKGAIVAAKVYLSRDAAKAAIQQYNFNDTLPPET